MFLHCSAGSLCSLRAVYAAPCSNANRRLASWAIIHGARWYAVCVSLSVSGCAPLPPSPGGSGKAGRLSGGSPCATTHSLLRLPAKHRPARSATQVQHTGNARRVCSPQDVLDRTCLSVRFSRLSKRARRYPMQDLVEARRKPARYFKHHPGTCI